MRRLLLASICGPLMLAVSMPAHAQVPAAATALTRREMPLHPPSRKRPRRRRVRTRPRRRRRAARGRFEEPVRAHAGTCFSSSGRLSSVEGDPARWQRYQDLRDGLLFTDARLLRETARVECHGGRGQSSAGAISAFSAPTNGSAASRSVGCGIKSRSSTASTPARRSRIRARRCWCWTTPRRPRRISTRTFRSRRSSTCASGATSAPFDSSATPTPQLDLTGGFTTTKHSGELPWGASFGFSNDNEVALPYNSRTNDVDVGAQWTNARAMIRAAYSGSWFNNLDDTLTWDNPLALTDSTSAPGRGRTALWPSNSLQTLSTAGYAKFAHRTQVTGSLAFGWWNNNEPLLPFTINSALPPVRAAARDRRGRGAYHRHERRASCRARSDDWRFSARFRRYDYNNETPRDRHHELHQLRHVGCHQPDRRPGSAGAQPQYVRRRRHVDQAPARGPHRRVHQQPQRLRLSHLRVDERERVAAEGRHRGLAVGHLPGALRVREPHRLGPRRAVARRHRRAARAAALRSREPHAQSLRRSGGRGAERGADAQPERGTRPGRLRRQLFRAAGGRRSATCQ